MQVGMLPLSATGLGTKEHVGRPVRTELTKTELFARHVIPIVQIASQTQLLVYPVLQINFYTTVHALTSAPMILQS